MDPTDDARVTLDEAADAREPSFAQAGTRVALHRHRLASKLGAWSAATWVAMCPITSLGMLLTAPGAQAPVAFGLALLALLASGGVLGLGALGLALTGRRRVASLSVDGDALRVRDARGAERVIPRAQVLDAILVPDGKRGHRVDVQLTRARTLSVAVAGSAEGDRLLDALGCGAERRRARVEPRSRGRAILQGAGWGTLAYFAAFIPVAIAAPRAPNGGGPDPRFTVLAMGVAALVAMLVAFARTSPKLVIGADGVSIEGHLGRRFVSLSGVASAEVLGGALVLRTREGTTQTLAPRGANAEQLEAAAHRINEAIEARDRRGEGGAEFAPMAMARAGRAVGEWREALGRLLETAAGFRQVGVDRATMLQTLRDVRASVEQRIAAALALTARKDPEAIEQVRVVAGSVADDHVRVALERVADGSLSDADVERALSGPSARRSDTEP